MMTLGQNGQGWLSANPIESVSPESVINVNMADFVLIPETAA